MNISACLLPKRVKAALAARKNRTGQPVSYNKHGISRFMSCYVFCAAAILVAEREKNFMNQAKIGAFLRELRKQKGLTQEQFAEMINVSNRTVSRWENGNNLPDLSILMELSDYYAIDLTELLNGERNGEKMNKETEEVVLQAAEYNNKDAERYTKRVRILLLAGALFFVASQIIQHSSLAQVAAWRNVSDFAEGAVCGMIVWGIIVTGKFGKKLRDFKKRLQQRS